MFFSTIYKHLRLDANFAAHPKRKWLENISKVNKVEQLKDVVKYISSGHTPYLHKVKESGDIDFLTVECVSPLEINESTFKKITTQHFDKEFKKNRIQKNSVVCTIKRRICNAYPFIDENYKMAFNQDISFFLPDLDKIHPVYLAVYLNCNVGQTFALRQMTEQINPYISVSNLSSLPIVILSMAFQRGIEKLFIKAKCLLQLGKKSYTQAEQLLLEEIGLLNFEPNQEPINIKSFQESFGTSGRLDAEYYQKKYEQIIEKVMQQPFSLLSDLVDIQKSIEPGSANYDDEGLPFMRVADYSKSGLTPPQKHLSDSFVNNNLDLVNKLRPKKGTVLFSKDGSVGTAYHLHEDFQGITSGAILQLHIKDQKKITPEYLTLVLNSDVVQKQAERDAGGSIILHWRVKEIENVVVPIIDYKKQQKITSFIGKSFTLKKQSEHFLEVAKRAVEIAIEEDEQVALAYIQNEVVAYEL